MIIDVAQEIAAFEKYAVERGWATTTRTVTVYALRAALSRIADPTDATEVRLYHDSLAHKTRKNFRATWRTYIQFRRERGMLPYPTSPPVAPRGKPTAAIRCSLPPEVVVALRALVDDNIPPKALATLTWGDVVEDGSDTRLRAVLDRRGRPLPTNVTRSYAPLSIAGRVALDDLRRWAGGGTEPARELPLVPMQPGHHIGASAGLIRQAVRDERTGSKR